MGAKDGKLKRLTEAAVQSYQDQHQALSGTSATDPLVVAVELESGQKWPEDGGSIEHWGMYRETTGVGAQTQPIVV